MNNADYPGRGGEGSCVKLATLIDLFFRRTRLTIKPILVIATSESAPHRLMRGGSVEIDLSSTRAQDEGRTELSSLPSQSLWDSPDLLKSTALLTLGTPLVLTLRSPPVSD